MKAKSLTNLEFKPVKIEIEIETKRELELLWCMFNAPSNKMAEYATKSIYDERGIRKFEWNEKCFDSKSEVWKVLENLKSEINE